MDTAAGVGLHTPPRAALAEADGSPLPTPPRLSHVYAADPEPNTPTARPAPKDDARELATPSTSRATHSLRSSTSAQPGARSVGSGLRKLRTCATDPRSDGALRKRACASAPCAAVPGRGGGGRGRGGGGQATRRGGAPHARRGAVRRGRCAAARQPAGECARNGAWPTARERGRCAERIVAVCDWMRGRCVARQRASAVARRARARP